MRKLFQFMAVIALLISCKKNKDVTIHSLGKAGEEFYFGEKVPVWAVTEGDKEDISYEWTATGGTFDGHRTQNLFENLWVAPAEPGEYTVTAKAKNGGTNSSRSTTMKVTRYFFDEFQSPYTFTGNGWAFSNADDNLVLNSDPAQSRAEIVATSSNTPNVRRTLNLAPLKIPFSVRTVLGWKTYFRANAAIQINLYFNRPANPGYPFIREIRWEIWPTVDPATTDNYQVRYEIFTPATNVSQFSDASNTLPKLIDPVKGKRAEFAIPDGGLKNLSMSIDANHVFHAYVDGNLWFTSNGIKDWLAEAKTKYPGFEDPLVKEFRVTFPAKEGSKPGSVLVMKSVYINSNNEILK